LLTAFQLSLVSDAPPSPLHDFAKFMALAFVMASQPDFGRAPFLSLGSEAATVIISVLHHVSKTLHQSSLC
jgi:hypothetical protein